MKINSIAVVPLLLLAGCDGSDNKVVGPEDYVHFSETFTMSEAVSNEMHLDGGTPMVDPRPVDPNAAILTADALPGDRIGEMLTATSPDSPAVVPLR